MKTPPSTAPQSAGRYATIDAWRGAACLAVLAYHVFGSSMHQPLWHPAELVRSVAQYGWLGLHVFFVLSGYCVLERIRSALRQGETPRAFFIDRALRIYPAYLAALLAAVVMNLLASPLNGTSLSQNLPPDASFWFGNVALLHVFLGEVPYLVVTWTLACELVFYIFSTGVLTQARGRYGVNGVLVSGGALCLASFWVLPEGWMFPLALWPDFFAGMCVGLALSGAGSRALPLLAALTVGAWLPIGPYATDARQCAMAFAWVLLALHRWDGALAQNRIVRTLSGIGAFSYSLYLMHGPLASRCVNLGFRLTETTSPWFAVFLLLGAVVALVGSWLFWRLIERRCERWRQARRKNTTRRLPVETPLAESPAKVSDSQS